MIAMAHLECSLNCGYGYAVRLYSGSFTYIHADFGFRFSRSSRETNSSHQWVRFFVSRSLRHLGRFSSQPKHTFHDAYIRLCSNPRICDGREAIVLSTSFGTRIEPRAISSRNDYTPAHANINPHSRFHIFDADADAGYCAVAISTTVATPSTTTTTTTAPSPARRLKWLRLRVFAGGKRIVGFVI